MLRVSQALTVAPHPGAGLVRRSESYGQVAPPQTVRSFKGRNANNISGHQCLHAGWRDTECLAIRGVELRDWSRITKFS